MDVGSAFTYFEGSLLKGIQLFDREGAVMLETGDEDIYEKCRVKQKIFAPGEYIIGHRSWGENHFHNDFKWITAVKE